MNTSSTRRSKGKYILLAVIVAAAIAGAWYLYGLRGTDVKKKYARNIVMIRNTYVYKVWFSDPEIGEIKFIRTPNGEFIPFDDEKMEPNEILAIGLVVHANGSSITSAKALYPWMDNNNQEKLRQSAQAICEHQHSLGKEMQFELTGGESVALEMYSGISLGRDKVEMTECTVVPSAEANQQSIGLLKPKAYAIPFEYAAIDLAGVNREELKEGTAVSLLGINDEAFSSGGETVELQKGKITSNVVSSNIYYSFENKFIAEGAPVFDKKGRLVGINSVFSDNSTAFLLGKMISFTETMDAITQKNFQQEISQVVELSKTMDEVDRAQQTLDSLLKGIDTIGQSLSGNVQNMYGEN
ncbi:MAG TPA: hypothetical protein VGO58_06335 [Chitinophagaceae bacterium]|jgi:hypothetical protein|nr:hypothetical protein [Chitinophagaceae bacterium]